MRSRTGRPVDLRLRNEGMSRSSSSVSVGSFAGVGPPSRRRLSGPRRRVCFASGRIRGSVTAVAVESSAGAGSGKLFVVISARSRAGAAVRSCPAAMSVTTTSSPSSSLKLVPKMTFASGSAASRIAAAARVTSPKPTLLEAATLKRIERAPRKLASSSGDAIACRAASTPRFSPLARPMPISAGPPSCMTARTSAKSRLISPGDPTTSIRP